MNKQKFIYTSCNSKSPLLVNLFSIGVVFCFIFLITTKTPKVEEKLIVTMIHIHSVCVIF
jgi:hypothetical protein